MPEMPTLGSPEKKQPPVAQVAIIAAVVGTVSGFAWWVTHRPPDAAPAEPTAAATPPRAAEAPAPPPAELAPTGAPAPIAAAPAPASAPPAPALAPLAVKKDKSGLKAFTATIAGPLETAVVAQVGRDVGGPLTQVVTRSLVWWFKVPGDLLKGDTLTAVYEERDGQEPMVHAVRFTSRKFGKTFEAFRFQAKGDAHARFIQLDGTTLEEQLVDPPIDDYEQITSLLRDGRRHKGVDFKAPVGTPVRATFDGVIARKNWNFRGNGNSLEIEESGGQGRTALFLHLSEIPRSVQPGDKVKRGQVLAKSGNTGRSFAPHLHYQLMKGATVVDPFESHKTRRDTLPPADRADFDAQVAKLKALMPAETIAGN
ncbi:MAG: M23 family metallopeptidase [Myxococcaceae bacterium]|nr:M23 family metallopeptidase [Myxococcaceae bacterium]